MCYTVLHGTAFYHIHLPPRGPNHLAIDGAAALISDKVRAGVPWLRHLLPELVL